MRRPAILVAASLVTCLFASVPPAAPAPGAASVKLDGYAEYRRGPFLLVEGQRVWADEKTRFKGRGEARSYATIPLGYEVRVKGERRPDGSVLARELDARPNGSAFMEGDLKAAFDESEETFRKRGRMIELNDNGSVAQDYGKLYENGPQVDRVRRVAARIVPPYLSPGDFRVYVVENQEWNAMAAPNRSIYVFSGLLEDMDDDELALVLGHELAHATHEHSRRQFKRGLLTQIAAATAIVAADEVIDGAVGETALQLGGLLGMSALHNSYSRGHEDQADRVGMRYAYEGGYDVSVGPHLWTRFADKYGDSDKIVAFFFSSHSRSGVRATKLQEEIQRNYAPNGQ